MENINIILPSACYSVEKILGISVGQENLKCFKVQWAPSWVTEVNLIGCEKMIAQFLQDERGSRNEESSNTLPCEIKVEDDEDCDVQDTYRSSCDGDTSNTPTNTDIQPAILNAISIASSDDKVDSNHGDYQLHESNTEENYTESTEKGISYDKPEEAEHSLHYQDIDIDISDVCMDRVTMSNELNTNTKFEYTSTQSKGEYSALDVRSALNLTSNQNVKCDNNEAVANLIPLQPPHLMFTGHSEYYQHRKPNIFDDTASIKKQSNVPRYDVFDNMKDAVNTNIEDVGDAKNLLSGNMTKLDGYTKNNRSEFEYYYKCSSCTRVFQRKALMVRHLRSHTRPFHCDVCTKQFSRKDNLQRHRKQHTTELPVECNICFRRYKSKERYAKHAKKHSDEYNVNLSPSIEVLNSVT